MLHVKDLTIQFQTDDGLLTAVDGVSFSLQPGETLGLVGESGCGKSVTAMAIPRLVPQPPGRITAGQILLDDVDLLQLPDSEMRKRRGRDIGVIFQEPMTALSPLHRIGDQLMETIRLHEPKTSRAQARQRALEWLRHVGIPAPESRLDAFPFELSGGMRQRVMIAQALILHPRIIIADEPTTALDVTIQAQILELMRHIRGRDAALLLITHDMGVVWETCDRMVVMYASRIVETGTVKDIFNRPRHPYTRGLMDSIPALSRHARRLPHIPGQVPSLLRLPPGCAFADRCPYADDACRSARPTLSGAPGDAAGQHGVACHHPLT